LIFNASLIAKLTKYVDYQINASLIQTYLTDKFSHDGYYWSAAIFANPNIDYAINCVNGSVNMITSVINNNTLLTCKYWRERNEWRKKKYYIYNKKWTNL